VYRLVPPYNDCSRSHVPISTKEHNWSITPIKGTSLRRSNTEAISEEHPVTLLVEVLTAGRDTTATTGTYIAFELARNSEIQEKLRAESVPGGGLPRSELM
jgi:hypothetical protein